MKVVILAGGFGTRLAEETEIRPKPMVEVGGKPLLWHIMKHYAHHGFREFVVALGYKGEEIKRYFVDYITLGGNMTVDLRGRSVSDRARPTEDWVVNLVDTGADSLTGGRVKRLEAVIGNEPFLVTYGDGVADIDIGALVAFHRSHGLLATVTATRPPARFGALVLDGDKVTRFAEKPIGGDGWINGGFMVLQPGIFQHLAGDETSLELTLEQLAGKGALAAFRHEGFWQCMDTLRDKRLLEHLWRSGTAPWKVWA